MVDCYRFQLQWFGIALIILGSVACNTQSTSSQTEETTDSLTVEIPSEETISPPEELIGTWQNTLILVGEDVRISEEDMVLPSRTFQDDGTMIVDSQMVKYTYEPGYIRSEHADLEEEAIIRLSADTLILAREVDTDLVEFIYVKK